MSFTWFRPEGPLRTREQVAREVHAVSLRRGLDELATVIALMTISVEVGTGAGNARKWWCPWNSRVPATKNYAYDSQSDDNRSSGYFQQQPGPNGEAWWGTPENMMTLDQAANTFLDRLPDDYGRAANNPRLAGEFAQRVQQSSFPDRYAERWDEAWEVLRRALDGAPAPQPEAPVVNPNWRGDPTFLPEVLRAEGLTVKEIAGWRERGHGDFGEIWGVVAHHTGSNNATAESIAFHPSLGLASQIHLGRDGVVTLCGVGIAWHAGSGSHAGLPRNDANRLTIGIEAANDGGGAPGKPHRSSWPDAQYNAYVKTVAAILRFLGRNSSRVISHKEWAGAAQGKWDPGAIDMDIFRADVQAQIDSKTGDDFMSALSSDEQRRLLERTDQIWGALFNPVNSRSKYKAEGEGAIHKTKDLVLNIDGMTHETLIERQAMMGNAEALALVKREADRGDKWAKVVLRYVEGE